MQLVILEDNISHIITFLDEISRIVQIKAILYFDNSSGDINLRDKDRAALEEMELIDKIVHTDTSNIYYLLDEYFSNNEVVFLFDVDLKGMVNRLPNKHQIAFANSKIRQNPKNRERFFVYSTALTQEQKTALAKMFENYYIYAIPDPNSIETVDIIYYKKNKEFCRIFDIEVKNK